MYVWRSVGFGCMQVSKRSTGECSLTPCHALQEVDDQIFQLLFISLLPVLFYFLGTPGWF